MPIYEYECDNCGKQSEVIQKFNDEPLISCPECGGHLHKLISHSSFVLKGTGWYVTDYARSGKTQQKDTKEKAAGKTEPKAETAAKT